METAIEPPTRVRIGLSLVALFLGDVAGFTLERIIRAAVLFGDEFGFTIFWFGVVSVVGWAVFGLPCVVIGSTRDRFTRPLKAGLIGGTAGAAIVLFLFAALSHGMDVFLSSMILETLAVYTPCGFVIGGTSTAAYALLLRYQMDQPG